MTKCEAALTECEAALTEQEVALIAIEIFKARANGAHFISYFSAVWQVKVAHGMIKNEKNNYYHKAAKNEERPTDARLNMTIEELSLTKRAENCLVLAHIKTVGDLVKLSEADLFKIKSMGSGGVVDIKECLTDLGLSLKKIN